MPVEIKVPSVGESITEGVLSRWLKKNGENVRADEPGTSIEQVTATGRGGRIAKEDVLSHLQGGPEESARAAPTATPTSPATPPGADATQVTGRETRQRMSAIRQRIADRLVASQN